MITSSQLENINLSPNLHFLNAGNNDLHGAKHNKQLEFSDITTKDKIVDFQVLQTDRVEYVWSLWKRKWTLGSIDTVTVKNWHYSLSNSRPNF